MNIIDKLGAQLGTFIGSVENGYEKARPASRPGYLGTAAQSDAWELDIGGMRDDTVFKRDLISSWVFSALMLIIGEVNATPLRIVKKDPEGEIVVPNHPVLELLEDPNPFFTQAWLWAYTIMWMKLEGNSYWLKIPNSDWSGVRELWPMPSNEVTPKPSSDSRVFLEGYTYSPKTGPFDIPRDYVVHFYNAPNPFNVFLGLSEIDAAQLAIDNDAGMSKWNKAFYGKNNTMPSAIVNFSTGNPRVRMPDSDILAIKDELSEKYSALDRKTLVTSANSLTVEKLGWAARDLDFIVGRKFTRAEILEIFGIPEGLFIAGATEANSRVAYRQLQDTCFTRTEIPIAQTITKYLVKPFYEKGLKASYGDIRPAQREFDLMEIDRSKGALKINEVRARFWKLQPLEGKLGDELYTGQKPQVAKPSGVPVGRPLVDPESQDGSGTNSVQQQDLRRWRTKVIRKFLDSGSSSVKFVSEKIDEDIQAIIRGRLEVVKSVEEIKAVFEEAIPLCN